MHQVQQETTVTPWQLCQAHSSWVYSIIDPSLNKVYMPKGIKPFLGLLPIISNHQGCLIHFETCGSMSKGTCSLQFGELPQVIPLG